MGDTKLYLFSIYLIFLVGALTCTGQEPFCTYPDINSYPTLHMHIQFGKDGFDQECLIHNNFTASIMNGTLIVENCPEGTAKWRVSHKLDEWTPYTAPVQLAQSSRFAYVICGGSKPLLVVRPAEVAPKSSLLSNTKAKNVFVVMLDALSHEHLYRTMPKTIEVLRAQQTRTVVEYPRYPYSLSYV